MQNIHLSILTSALLTGCFFSDEEPINSAPDAQAEIQQPARIELDSYTSKKLDSVFEKHLNSNQFDTGQAIDLISGEFLGTPYKANMLHGSEYTPEQLVIDFNGLDCFTYLDYVQALLNSTSKPEFVKNLIQTRYTDGNIIFLNRKHFFTDWAYSKTHNPADDITARLSPAAMSIEKNLNEKSDGGAYLPGLPVVKRTVTYIPSDLINEKTVNQLQTGDLIGIYTKLPGLDVTHVGFFIMTDTGPVLRNASSRKENEKVVDSPFLEYVANTPGIIVFRTKS